MFPNISPTKTRTWQQLSYHYAAVIKPAQMKDLFIAESNRFDNFSLRFDDLLFDYSKNMITGETLGLLQQLAEDSKVKEALEAMFMGEKINRTEGRSVLHTALRNFSGKPVFSDGIDVMPEVFAVLNHMQRFCQSVH